MSHELTLQELAEFSANFNADPKNQVIARAAARAVFWKLPTMNAWLAA